MIPDRFDEIVRRLDAEYGPRLLSPSGDGIGQLVGTILSQNTSDVNSSRAMDALLATYPTWDDVRCAETAALAAVIRTGGLATIKAPRIQRTLARVAEATGGSYDLGFLASLPPDEAMAWLTALDGIGVKTAACVLLFAYGVPVMPVDTHVGRVMTRLGVLPARIGAAARQKLLETLIGPDGHAIYVVHVETIAHGRHICRAQHPRCSACVVRDCCDFYRTH